MHPNFVPALWRLVVYIKVWWVCDQVWSRIVAAAHENVAGLGEWEEKNCLSFEVMLKSRYLSIFWFFFQYNLYLSIFYFDISTTSLLNSPNTWKVSLGGRKYKK